FGIFEGLTADECRTRFASEFARFVTFDADFVVPGGESRAQHLQRIVVWLRDVAIEFGGGVGAASHRVLAITHGGTIDFLYRAAIGVPLHGGQRIHSGEHATLAIFEGDWPNVRLVDFDAPLDIG